MAEAFRDGCGPRRLELRTVLGVSRRKPGHDELDELDEPEATARRASRVRGPITRRGEFGPRSATARSAAFHDRLSRRSPTQPETRGPRRRRLLLREDRHDRRETALAVGARPADPTDLAARARTCEHGVANVAVRLGFAVAHEHGDRLRRGVADQPGGSASAHRPRCPISP